MGLVVVPPCTTWLWLEECLCGGTRFSPVLRFSTLSPRLRGGEETFDSPERSSQSSQLEPNILDCWRLVDRIKLQPWTQQNGGRRKMKSGRKDHHFQRGGQTLQQSWLLLTLSVVRKPPLHTLVRLLRTASHAVSQVYQVPKGKKAFFTIYPRIGYNRCCSSKRLEVGEITEMWSKFDQISPRWIPPGVGSLQKPYSNWCREPQNWAQTGCFEASYTSLSTVFGGSLHQVESIWSLFGQI